MKKIALAGSGIKAIAHFTTEFKACVQNADKVLYLINEPITKEWIKKNSKNSENLDSIYFAENDRSISYENIKNKILDDIQLYDFITVVLYGHPTVFAQPGLDAIQLAKENNIETIILPGISIENCMYADFAIDPGEFGCIHVEASDFLLYNKTIDPSFHLFVWQAGMIGTTSTPKVNQEAKYLNLLRDKLFDFYPKNHNIYLYEASLYPSVEAKIKRFTLIELESMPVTTITTLYVPPIIKNVMDPRYMVVLEDAINLK